MVVGEGSARFLREASRYWTEHSERAGLDSWAAALGVQETERAFLGRWSATGSVDMHVRIALRVVKNVHLLLLRHARWALHSGPDFFGEEHLLATFRTHLENKGWSKKDAKKLEKGMVCANCALEVSVPALGAHWALEEPNAGVSTPTGPADSASKLGLSDLEALLDPEPPAGTSQEELALLEEAQKEAFQPTVDEPWGFVVSITQHGRHRKLHHVGSCKLKPDVDYLDV